MYPLYKSIFGFTADVTKEQFAASDKVLKDCVKTLDKELVKNEWFGLTAEPSFADYALACYLAIPFQTMLD